VAATAVPDDGQAPAAHRVLAVDDADHSLVEAIAAPGIEPYSAGNRTVADAPQKPG